ncbi:IDEAL domain-containing protein [Jeotgalicoccus halotolerans]|uniref:IDEAL domain-containing protein n=2 Tax=Jeotgalicoccus TaxID=227979 RepID=A0A3E0AZW0_9STAP|nr:MULTISPECIES: IDEAL domain-containing protein [Jeotgalicoccus]MBF0754529.1 IDEAL domain-containing protein [Jeotgalicoccus nanhaiensis]REG25256.1 IDEAL domain-containing protein [Jeotgalicoccus halotolerans]TFU61049.1 IDEAL domain-containing protein [Jeotgalicoccus nanhaiensis]
MGRPVYPANQLRGFINTINDLSADLVLQESMYHFNVQLYRAKIEESLIEKDEEKFIKYTNLLKEL